jgi:hypothetical protein
MAPLVSSPGWSNQYHFLALHFLLTTTYSTFEDAAATLLDEVPVAKCYIRHQRLAPRMFSSVQTSVRGLMPAEVIRAPKA